MKQLIKLGSVAIAAALAVGLAACQSRPAVTAQGANATPGSASGAASAAARSGDVTRATLDNGLRVVIVRDDLAPMVTTQITYRAGGYETPQGFPGTAHALEHMMFRDSNGMTGAQLNEMTGKMGARNNAFTTADATQYYFVAPAQYTGLLLKIESIRMRGARLGDKGWSLEKGAIEQEVSRDISNPDYLAYAQARKILFAGTGYAHDALGSRPTFDKTTGKTLQGFYNKWYRPNNAILVVVGNVNPAQTLAQVKQLFGGIAKGKIPARAPVKVQPFKSRTIAKTTPDATGTVEYVYRLPGQRAKDYPALELLMDVLDNDRSRLSDLAAEGKVLSSGAGAQSYTHGGMGFITAGFPKGGSGKKAADNLDAVIAHVRQHGVPPELVAAAKRQARASFEFAHNSAVSLASRWSNALAWAGLNSPKEALDRLLAVTPAEVNAAARKYLDPSQRVKIVLTPSPNGKRPPQSRGFGGTEKFASNDKLNAPLPEWATRRLARLELPHWTLAPVAMTLANGIRLIVQPETISKTVTVIGGIDNNIALQTPTGKMGSAGLLRRLFDYGTTTLDRDAFHKALDEIAASVSAGTSFSLAVPSRYFDRGVRLLADDQLHPALPEKAFKTKQKSLARTTAGWLKTPRHKMIRALYKGLLPKGDPGLRQATPESINKLTLADIKAYKHEVYRPDMTTIVVVGDVTPAKARAEVEKYFGQWKASGPKPDVIEKPVTANPASYTVVKNAYASQDTVFMGQMMALNLHEPDRYALQLGNEVLGGNGFASRLMVDVRVNHGYAYGAGSGMSFSRSRSIFFVRYASDPDKVKPVDRLVRKNIEEMRDTPVKPQELRNAKQARIRGIPLEVSSVDAIGRSLLGWSINGEPLDEPMVAAHHYVRMTASDVQDAFKHYIKPANLVQVVQGPTPKQHRARSGRREDGRSTPRDGR